VNDLALLISESGINRAFAYYGKGKGAAYPLLKFYFQKEEYNSYFL